MMSWDPFKEIEELRREIDKVFNGFGFRSGLFPRVSFLPGRDETSYPLVNIHEDKDTLYVEALAPGVDPDSLNLTVLGNTLTISGEKKKPDAKPESFHRNERAAGRFVRKIELPVEVDQDSVKADYRNGLLVITMPKAEEAKPKAIPVKAA